MTNTENSSIRMAHSSWETQIENLSNQLTAKKPKQNQKRSKKKLEEAHAIYGQNAQQKRRGGAISERLKRLAGRKSKSASPTGG